MSASENGHTGGYTPGPWKMVSDQHFDTGLTYTSVQPVDADPATMRPLLMASGEYHICRTTHTAARHAIRLHQANARLIAAAPEMLDELRNELDAVLDDIRWADGGELERLLARRDRLSAIISKAEGGAA